MRAEDKFDGSTLLLDDGDALAAVFEVNKAISKGRFAANLALAAQDALVEELYAEPEPENSGETAEGTESKESEGAEPSAESEATE